MIKGGPIKQPHGRRELNAYFFAFNGFWPGAEACRCGKPRYMHSPGGTAEICEFTPTGVRAAARYLKGEDGPRLPDTLVRRYRILYRRAIRAQALYTPFRSPRR